MHKRISRNDAMSPVIATVLLVALTVMIGAVVYMWVANFGATKSAPRVHGKLSSPDPATYKIDLTTQEKGSLVDIQYLLLKNGNTFESGKFSDVYNQNITIKGNVSFVDMDNDGFLSNGDSILIKKQNDTTSVYTLKLIFIPTSETVFSIDLVTT